MGRKLELTLATNFGLPCTNGYQIWWPNFGYQIWFCTRLLIVNWILSRKVLCNFNQITNILTQENTFENVCKRTAILLKASKCHVSTEKCQIWHPPYPNWNAVRGRDWKLKCKHSTESSHCSMVSCSNNKSNTRKRTISLREPCELLVWTATDTSKSIVILSPKHDWIPHSEPSPCPAHSWGPSVRRAAA